MAEQRQEFVDFEVEADFANVQEFGGGGFKQLPEGEYIFEVSFVEQESSSNNNQMVVVYSKVAEGQETEEAAAQTGQEARTNYVLLPQSIGRLKNLMIACGAPLDDKFRASAVMGARYRGTIVHSEGKSEAGPDGQPKPARMYANITNERALDSTVAATPPPPPPPVTKAGSTKVAPAAVKPAGNSAGQQPRRA